MVSDTSLTTWNGLTQPACFSSHHFRWHFSLQLSMLYIQHSAKWFLEPLQPHQPCGAGGWQFWGRESNCLSMCLHVHALQIQLFSSIISEGDLKSSSSAFLCLSVLCPIRLWQEWLFCSITSEMIWDQSILLYIPVSGRCLWSRWWLMQAMQCSQQLSCPARAGAQLPVCPDSILSADINPHTQPPPHSSHIPSALLSSSHFHMHTQQRTYQRPHFNSLMS